jgi:serine phosphatase RsbU (regulator of sigma subunit)
MFIIYVMIVLVSMFFILFGYYNQLSVQEDRQYDKLKAIVSSIAINIDGDDHVKLMNRYTSKEELKDVNHDSTYFKINALIRTAVKLNDLNSAMYTLIYSEGKDVFKYGVRSDNYIDFKNEYKKYPKILKKKMDEGGTIPMYETENGIWLSAFHPIKNSNGQTVAILEADIDFSEFKSTVNSTYLRQAIIAILVVLLIAFLLLPYSRKVLREDDLKKKRFMQQKLIIEQSHREIKDSINYAKRIQSAILPPSKTVKKYLENSFVLYKPKDVVAGDFYWLETLKDQKTSKELILVASCDCTGHGVPGAMVSVICNNALNRSVREYKLSNSGEILDQTRKIVIEEFEKSDDDVQDGMDISLAVIDFDEVNEKTNILWSGANNPFWIIKKGDSEVTEIKPDKQPIGKYDKINAFTTHEMQLGKADLIYLLTDGYQDQFGGETEEDKLNGGKKFKPARFKELLLSIRNEPMETQKDLINKAFKDWKGGLDQVDDICIIGIRL